MSEGTWLIILVSVVVIFFSVYSIGSSITANHREKRSIREYRKFLLEETERLLKIMDSNSSSNSKDEDVHA